MSGADGSEKPLPDRWESGDPYEQYVGRWSRLVAAEFLAWLAMPPGLRWMDVGCGTGALCAAVLDRCAPGSVVGIEPSEGFLGAAKSKLGGRVAFHSGKADSIPLASDSVDVVVSGLVLNFVPDPERALREMARVLDDRHGTVAAYVWDYAGKMELMRYFWDTAVQLDPAAATLDEGRRFPLCNPEPLQVLFTQCGMGEVEVRAIDIVTRFADFDDYWTPFLGGQGPAPAYVMSLSEEARARLRDALREAVPLQTDGSVVLVARAWAVRGRVANQRPRA